jgi:hypothetical protein
MEASLTDHVWSIVELLGQRNIAASVLMLAYIHCYLSCPNVHAILLPCPSLLERDGSPRVFDIAGIPRSSERDRPPLQCDPCAPTRLPKSQVENGDAMRLRQRARPETMVGVQRSRVVASSGPSQAWMKKSRANGQLNIRRNSAYVPPDISPSNVRESREIADTVDADSNSDGN